MMSLFSSFDLIFFYFSAMFLPFILTFMASSYIFLNSSLVIFIQHIYLNLSSFFFSLKNKNFNSFSLTMLLSLIMVTFFMNFFSIFSFNFPSSSQFGVILFLSLSFWSSFFGFNLINNFKGVFSHLVPEGTPIYLTTLLFLIELISNFIRPLTLTVRLVANILAGHLLMILLSKLVFIFPYVTLFYFLLNLVEIFVALIQSYIFVTMMTLYFSDVH